MAESTRGERLQQARKRMGLTQADMAKKLGKPPATYGSYERAQSGSTSARDWSFEDAQAFAKHLKCDANWLYSGDGSKPPINRLADTPTRKRNAVRIVGYIGASTGEGSLYGFADDQYDEVDRPIIPEKAVAAEVRGRSFGPLMDRMLVFYEDVRRPVTDDLVGSICVVGLPDNRILLKKIARGKGGKWSLLSNAPDEAPIETDEIVWAAKMIAITPR